MRDSTRLPYPRSFLGLLLTGFTLVMLPLVGSLAYSAWNTERLAAGEITEHVDRLSDSAREVLAISNLIVDREVERLRFNAEHVQRSLILLVIFSTAVALSIALALTRYISRPIAEIDAAIRQLGAADFSRPISVRGPEDLRYLGRRLDWLRRRLDEFEAQKNRFLRHVPHELKTPP